MKTIASPISSGRKSPDLHPEDSSAAFTLIELLIVIAIIGILIALVVPALTRSRDTALSVHCLNNMRQVGTAVMLYADDHNDTFPRSQHSAFAHGELPWARAVAPYLGSSSTSWKDLLKNIYRCSQDQRPSSVSYGLNVYFELGPDDDYPGYPATWRRRIDVSNPSSTILIAENNSEADHIMPNFWSSPGDAVDVATDRHNGKANYIFADGHAESRDFISLYNPGEDVDLWNPGASAMH